MPHARGQSTGASVLERLFSRLGGIASSIPQQQQQAEKLDLDNAISLAAFERAQQQQQQQGIALERAIRIEDEDREFARQDRIANRADKDRDFALKMAELAEKTRAAKDTAATGKSLGGFTPNTLNTAVAKRLDTRGDVLKGKLSSISDRLGGGQIEDFAGAKKFAAKLQEEDRGAAKSADVVDFLQKTGQLSNLFSDPSIRATGDTLIAQAAGTQPRFNTPAFQIGLPAPSQQQGQKDIRLLSVEELQALAGGN